MCQYIRVIRKCKNNVRVELPDHTTTLIPVSEFLKWELIESKDMCATKDKVKTRSKSNKKSSFTRNLNGLGVAHPYETVNMVYESVIFDDDIEVPF